jgi:hypothetical protein
MLGKFFLLITALLFADLVTAQKKDIAKISQLIDPIEIKSHLSFLAADEMRGREAGTPELNIASNYIKSVFNINGVKSAPGLTDFIQSVTQYRIVPPKNAIVVLNGQQFVFRDNLLLLNGDSLSWKGEVVYAGYGSEQELAKVDYKGKVVLALAGSRDAETLGKALTASREKYANVIGSGGKGLIELVVSQQTPWPTMVNFLTVPVWGLRNPANNLPHAWIKPLDLPSLKLSEGEILEGSFEIYGRRTQVVPGRNVIAYVEGTDQKLKNEYVIVTAHYDHIGVQKTKENQDSIFNGARDNAIGTVALLEISKFLAKNPPKRSVILAAVTSEEKGMLGSTWYTEHPVVPLNRHVLSVNCDGVGYNDKSIITSISFGRTSTDEIILRAAKSFGLNVGGDPDPKENFFERSDQVAFARKGVVAIKLQPGLARMDEEIRKYYHRAADEVSSLDFDYLTKFYKTFVYAVDLLANDPSKPSWKQGDKFEKLSKELYSETK